MHHRRGRLRRGGGGTAQSADRTGESWGCDCGGFLAEPLPLFPLSPIPSPAEGKGELCQPVPMLPSDPDCPLPWRERAGERGQVVAIKLTPPAKMPSPFPPPAPSSPA